MSEGAVGLGGRAGRARLWSSPAARRRLPSVQLRRSWPSLLATGVALVLLIALGFSSGGYFGVDYLQVGALAFVALAVVLAAHVPAWTIQTSTLVAIASLAGLAVWTGLSAGWSPDPSAAVAAMQRDGVYVALFALGTLAAGSGRHARLIPWAVLLVIAVVCGAGLLSRLAPDLVHSDLQPAAQGRLSYPLSYWNAFGALAGMGVVLALGLAADAGAPVLGRTVASAVAVPLGAALWLSLSRGSWLATIAGVVVLLLIGARRGSVLVTVGVLGGAIALAVLRLRAYPTLTDHPGAPGAQGDGHVFAVQLALITAAAAAGMALIAAGRSSPALMHAGRVVVRPVALVALGVVLLILLGVYAADQNAIEGRSARGTTSLSAWISRQWDDFLTPSTFSEGGAARLTTAKGTRSDLYRVAFDGFGAHPLRGDGAGGFHVRWQRERRVDESVIDTHSLELQTLAELGLVGLLLLGGLIGSAVTALVRARRRPGALGRGQVAAVAAGGSVWLVSSAVDWEWQMPVVTGTALVLVASAFPAGRRRSRRTAV